MRAPDIDVPRDIATAATAQDTIARSARLLREYGWDATRARTKDEIATDREFQPIHELVHRDPEAAWSPILAFIERYPGSLEASMLLEDVIDRDADAFVDRVEAEAQTSRPFQDTFESVYLGQISLSALDRLELLQETIRRSRESGDG